MAFDRVTDLIDRVEAFNINQYAAAWEGDSGAGVPMTLTALNDAINYPLRVGNQDTTNGRAFKVFKANLVDAWIDVTKLGTRIDGLSLIQQASTPSAPGAGLNAIYPKTDGRLYMRAGAAGAEIELLTGGTANTSFTFTQQGSAPSAPGSGLTTLYSRTSTGGLFYRAGAAGGEISLLDATNVSFVSGKSYTRPSYGGDGIIVTPEYFYTLLTGNPPSSIVPGTTDETQYVQAAIDYLKGTLNGGTVLFEPRTYKLGPLNMTNRYMPSGYYAGTDSTVTWDGTTRGALVDTVASGAIAAITLRGTRSVSTANGATAGDWGTCLKFDVAPAQSTDAQKASTANRSCIDMTGLTYGAIEDLQIQSQTLNGDGINGAAGTGWRANAGIMMGGISGHEATAFRVRNVLCRGAFTSAALVVYTGSFVEISYSQFYNYFKSQGVSGVATNTPSGEQGMGYGGIFTGRNFVNPELKGAGAAIDTTHDGTADPGATDAKLRRYAAYSNWTAINAPANPTNTTDNSHGHGSDQGHILSSQFHDFSYDQLPEADAATTGSKGAGLRLHSVRYLRFDHGDIANSKYGVEINDQVNDPSFGVSFTNYWFHGNRITNTTIDQDYAVYLKSATTMYGLSLIDCVFEASDACVGANSSTAAIYDNLKIINPMIRRFPQYTPLAPTNGLIHMNSGDATAVRIKNSYIEGQKTAWNQVQAAGSGLGTGFGAGVGTGAYKLTNVGIIDGNSIVKDVGTLTGAGSGAIRGLQITANGLESPAISTQFLDSNFAQMVAITPSGATSSNSNYFSMTNATSGSGPTFASRNVAGSGNVNLNLVAQGSGSIILQSASQVTGTLTLAGASGYGIFPHISEPSAPSAGNTALFANAGDAALYMRAAGAASRRIADASILTTTGDILYASSASNFARLAAGAANTVIRGTGIGAAPVYGQVETGDIAANAISQMARAASTDTGATITSATYVDMGGMSVTLNGVASSSTVIAFFSGSLVNSAAAGDIYVGLQNSFDSTDNEITSAAHPTSGGRTSLSGSWSWTGISGSITFKARWRVGGGGTGTPLNRNMTVIEIKK